MVKIYITDLNFSLIASYRPYFSEYRKKRLQKIKNEVRFSQAEAAEALLCYAAEKEGYSLPLDIKTEKNGKPYAENINFSISHSGNRVLVAIAPCRIGADIQRINEEQNLSVATKILTSSELLGIDTHDFFRLFTMKESYFKMTGEGLPFTPKPFSNLEKSFFATWEKDEYMMCVCTCEKEEKVIEFVV